MVKLLGLFFFLAGAFIGWVALCVPMLELQPAGSTDVIRFLFALLAVLMMPAGAAMMSLRTV
jgi:hypothetical protein